MSKVYAVRVGRQTGLFNSWPECEAQIKHFPCAEYKSFITIEEAEAYLNRTHVQPDVTDPNAIIVYVDGSYNPSTEECGYASFLMHGNKKKILCVETGKIYDSFSEAAKEYGVKNLSSFSAALRSERNTAYGLHWRRA